MTRPRRRCTARVGRRRLLLADATGDDVGVDAAVAVAVERPVVDDHGVLHARDDVGARGVGEEQPQSPAFPRRSLDANRLLHARSANIPARPAPLTWLLVNTFCATPRNAPPNDEVRIPSTTGPLI